MSNQHGYPNVGATFYPGGVDDFYMPEVISPAPQRVMPEVPEQIQDNLAHLELEANGPQSPPQHWHPGNQSYRSRDSSVSTLGQQNYQYQNGVHQGGEGYGQPPNNQYSNPPPNTSTYPQDPYARDYSGSSYHVDQPRFSPFPKLENPPPNVPPTDDEREVILEQARIQVLNSNDPEMQLQWAQDSLVYVEAAIQHELRIAENQPARPQTPQVEHQLRVDAINVVSFLAEQHHPKAEFMRGMWLEFGKFGFRVDKKEAFRCYSRAAEKGYARAEYRIGMQYETSNEPAKAIRHYTRGVAKGDSASNYRLGMMTLLGQHGQKQDYARGVQLIRYAAQHSDENAPQGAYIYGMLLARELPQITVPEVFLPFDLNGARMNIERAAFLGFARAQLKMGLAYELCQLGCDFNPALSLHYNALAARQGEPEADIAISKWFLCGYDGVFEKNEELAFTYAQRAAQSALPTAEFAMGYYYEIGMFVSRDLSEARKWYEKAAEHGNKDASGRLDGLSRSQTLSKKDHENVAIARIKSQYGSQRGKRPERFKTPAPPMPTIADRADSPVAMPDPSEVKLPRGGNLAHHNAGGPPQGPPRPTSAAPYPLDSGPPRLDTRPGTAAGFVNPSVRPNSAFGISPNIRPTSAASIGPVSPVGYPAGSSGPGYTPQRPYSSFGNVGPSRGRGRPTQRPGPTGPSNQGYRQPTPAGRGAPAHEGLSGGSKTQDDPNRAQIPRLDIGFQAPLDDRRHRLQKPSAPDTNKPQPTVPDLGHKAPLNSTPATSKPSPLPHSKTFANDQRPSSTRPPNGRTGAPGTQTRQESMPPNAMSGARPVPSGSPPLATPDPPAKNTTAAAKSTAPKPTTAPPAAARPPGQGPKTFDEMGVPQHQKENECVVM
ncbi:MAG: hypothetical protein M1836_000047 [Candelina mexicana]|nr:MAG: hypothetical protein M1836_000047 [Candelina mexicana]